jgi:hypothetical protein
MTRLVSLSLVIAALSLAGCPSDGGGGPACETDPNSCGGGNQPDARPACGDGVCASTETATSCPADCGPPPPRCGNNTCEASETAASCPQDCARCGDNVCSSTEDATSCPSDCAASVTFDNRTTTTIYFLYWWKCGTSSKGPDRLGATTLAPNYHITFNTVDSGCMNFEVDSSSGYLRGLNNQQLLAQSSYTWTIQ